MKKPMLLLVGVDQCSWDDWKIAECAAVTDPFGFDTSGLNMEVLEMPLFDPRRFDGVVFAIPNYQKAVVPLICQALEAGLPALVHKLRVNHAKDMDPVRCLPQECRDRLYIGEHYQYLPGALALRKAVHGGLCGKVEAVQYRCALSMSDHPSWMDAYKHLILEDLSYHHMTVVQAACGPLYGSVIAQSWNPGWLGSVRGYASLLLTADAGWRMSYDTRWGQAGVGGRFFGELTVEGADGAVWTDGSRATFTMRDGLVQELPVSEGPYVGWSGIVDHFGDVLVGRNMDDMPELLRFDQFDSVLRMLYAAVDSAEQGRKINFN